MPVTVQYASDADAPRAFEIEHEAYTLAADPMEPLMFPGPFPPDASQKRAADVLERKALDPTTVWLKAVDTATGEMIVRLSSVGLHFDICHRCEHARTVAPCTAIEFDTSPLTLPGLR